MIFVSHDLSLAAELADRVATTYAGRIVELGEVERIFYHPRHPYTVGLLDAVPTLAGEQQELSSIPGSPPDLIDLPCGLQIPSAVPLRNGQVPRGGPSTDRGGSRADGRMLALGEGRFRLGSEGR